MDFEWLAGICCKEHKVVSIVGAGGKTSLMYKLAEECSKVKGRVLVSTTAHIAEPESHLAMNEEEVLRLWGKRDYAVIGTKAPGGKLSMPSDEMLKGLKEKADLVLLEADGSKQMPCKVPEEHEPVIFPDTSLVIAVMGMSCLGKRMGECCFRMEAAQRYFGVSPDTVMSQELAVSILSSGSGARKAVEDREFIVVLNQCDTEELQRKAENIAEGLRQKGIEEVVLTCLFCQPLAIDMGVSQLSDILGGKMQDFYQKIKEYKEKGPCMAATVLEGEHIGEKMLFCQGRLIWQSEPEGFLQKYLEKLRATEDTGILRFGKTRVFIECFGGNDHLVICGAGHVSMAVIRIGKSIGFDVTVLEDRAEFADGARRAGADQVICASFEEGLKKVPGSRFAYFVIVTRGHRYDMLCLKKILEKENGYVGMMGSRRRAGLAREQLLEEGIKKELLARVHMPIGLPIGAESPEEIAVSVMAEIIQHKNKKKQAEGYRDEILEALDIRDTRRNKAVLAEIVWRKGSAPRAVGAKMLIGEDGTLTGTLGGGCMEAEVIWAAGQMLGDESGSGDHRLVKLDLTTERAEGEGMVCGGTQLVYLEKRR